MTVDGPLYSKFRVERTDGTDEPGGKHDGCDYFVLDITHDPAAPYALIAYAGWIADTHPILANELRTKALAKIEKDKAELRAKVTP